MTQLLAQTNVITLKTQQQVVNASCNCVLQRAFRVEKDEAVTLKAKNQRGREKIVKCVSLDPQSRIEKNPSGGKRMQKSNQTF